LLDRAEGLDAAGLTEHLIHLILVQLFVDDHLASILLEQNRLAFNVAQQFIVAGQRRLLVL